ncbi:MAG: hypothetical protein RJB45_1019 [Pseudomonadota bacterium]
MEYARVLRAARLKKVVAQTGLSKTQISRLMQRGQFPLPVRLSERVVAWDESVINAWLLERFSSVGGPNA